MIHHYILPHKKKNKHKKAHLLSIKALLLYIGVFVFLQIGFFALKTIQPGVLGTTSAITKEEIIDLTNKERQKYGISTLRENSELDQAAEFKAQNMFAENYWAHFSPSGKTPWEWIRKAGYDYSYAGENLARGFSNSNDTMAAWMASKMGHKENVLGQKYQEIGIAVEDGVLNGEKTTLVVQLFGTRDGASAENPQLDEGGANTKVDTNIATNVPGPKTTTNTQEVNSVYTKNAPPASFLSRFITINPYNITKNFSLLLIIVLTLLGLVDLYVMSRRKQLSKLHLRHFPHAAVIFASIIVLIVLRAGSII